MNEDVAWTSNSYYESMSAAFTVALNSAESRIASLVRMHGLGPALISIEVWAVERFATT